MEFANLMAGLGLSLLALTAYVWSFHDLWDPSVFGPLRSSWAILFFALSVGFFLFVWQREAKTQLLLTTGVLVVGGILCASSFLSGASANISEAEFLFTFTTNLMALILGTIIIAVSLINERRLIFWLGSLYLVLLVLSRFLEYETSLLVKSAAFLACGVAVILAGISYERYVRRSPNGIEAAKEKPEYE